MKDKGLGATRCLGGQWRKQPGGKAEKTAEASRPSGRIRGVIIQQRMERHPKGAVFVDIKYSIEGKGNNGKYSLAVAIRGLLKIFKRTSKHTGNKSRNEEVELQQSEALPHRWRDRPANTMKGRPMEPQKIFANHISDEEDDIPK